MCRIPPSCKPPFDLALRLTVLASACLLFGTDLASAQIVVNEVHYDPPKTAATPVEFIELYNRGSSTVDLSGWKFDSGVDYTFPAGTSMAAGGYLVVASDAAAFQTTYGFAAKGPWTGKLSNDGEEIRLRDASNNVISDFTYGAGFPWPTAARGEGSSMELINPALDPNLPGSWRSSGQPSGSHEAQVYVPPVATNWSYRKGTSEASNPTTAWRQVGFTQDASWLTGQTSVGFGDNDDNTILTDMQGNYSSLFLRRVFNIAAGQIPSALLLQVRVDDGCVVWINGTEVARFHVPSGNLAYNSLASDHEADVTQFEQTTLLHVSSYLVEGQNVIAVHALNATLSSSDFTIDVQLSQSFAAAATAPTPGAKNSCFSGVSPPSVDNVAHAPLQPTSNQPVTITARVKDPEGVGAVNLSYQLVNPGSYIRKTDAAYATSWTNVAMHDDGLNGDATAADGVYTAVLPATLQVHRRLVRYRVSATDSGGQTVQAPYADDGSPNFAYFVYDGIPSWTGAFFPGTTPANTFTPALMQTLPVYQLMANSTDVTNSQYVSSYDGTQMWGTMIYNGRVYDHIQFYNRGEYSTYVSGKNKWRFRFNTARDFHPLDNWGRSYPETWDTLNLNACAEPWDAVNRGMSGIDEAISMRIYELTGTQAPHTHYLHFRVIDDASETGATQYSGGDPSGVNGGDLWGLYLAVEQPDSSFLDARGLNDGNVYKIESNTGDKKHQAVGQPLDTSDWDNYRSAATVAQSEAWWRANLDLPAYFAFAACNRLMGNVDLREGWNHLMYHNSDGHWVVMPWDVDMMFMPKTQQSGTVIEKNSILVANIAIEYRNRAREILDLMASDSSTTGGQIGQLVDEYAQIVNPTGVALTWADLDAAMWNRNPRTTSSPNAYNTNHFGNFYKTPFTDTRIGGNWTRTLQTSDFEGSVKYIIDYTTNTLPAGQTWAVNSGNQLGYGYKYLESEAADTAIPNRPTITDTGTASHPLNDLRFTSSAYSGTGAFAAMQWRIGEISAPGIPLYDSTKPRIYEITDAMRTGEITTFAAETRLPGGTLQAGHTYRARVRHKDTTGRWSRWSTPIQFVAGAASVTPYQQNLEVTQIMYNPPALTAAETTAGFTDKQDFEFIELQNIGSSPLDISSVSFTAGITFTFPTNTVLAAGARILVVKNVAAFTARYGSGKPIAGAYTGNLDNGGELLTLAYGGTTILSFAYSDGSHPAPGQTTDPWPVEADGGGYSLVLDNPASHPDLSLAANWRTSRKPGGNPGLADVITYADWALQYPSIGASTADPDTDSRTNGTEYAFGSDPTHADYVSIAPGVVKNMTVNSVTAPYLTVTFTRQIGASDLHYAVQFSSDLTQWTSDGVRQSAVLNGNGTVTETWRSAQPVSASSRLFLRVKQTN